MSINQQVMKSKLLLESPDSIIEHIEFETSLQSSHNFCDSHTCGAVVDFSTVEVHLLAQADACGFWRSDSRENIVECEPEFVWVNIEEDMQSWALQVHVHDPDPPAFQRKSDCDVGCYRTLASTPLVRVYGYASSHVSLSPPRSSLSFASVALVLTAGNRHSSLGRPGA